MTANFLYKCALCGQVHSPCGTAVEDNIQATFLILGIEAPALKDKYPKEKGFHDCGEGRIGISKLVGIKLN